MHERAREAVEPPTPPTNPSSDADAPDPRLSAGHTIKSPTSLPHQTSRFPLLFPEWPFRDLALVLGDPNRPDAVKPGKSFQPDDISDLETTQAVLQDLGLRVTLFQDHSHLIDALRDFAARPRVFALNFCDNGYCNNAAQELHIPALLEMLGIPYSGAGPAALARCYDKFSVGRTATALGVPAPQERVIQPGDTDLADISDNWACFPAFLKLNAADNSFGIMPESLVKSRRELLDTLKLFRTRYPEKAILLQEFLGGREHRLWLIGNPGTGFVFLPIAERAFINADSPYVTYYYKYNPLAEQASPAFRSRTCTLDAEKQAWLQRACVTLFTCFGCRDYATFDFREDAEGVPKILDVNPNPSWDRNSMINDNDEKAGYVYPDALRFLIASAQARYVS